MKFNIFYSWQSDLPNKTNHTAIENALKKAIKNIKKDEFDLEIAIDRDTKGLSGTPDINKAIFDKIKNSQIFVGDISIINSKSDIDRKCPNPNVLIELGFATGVLKWDKVISVFNKNYGSPEDLPFDLKFRRPLTYNASEEFSDIDSLVTDLEKAIKSIISDYKHVNTIYAGRSHGRLENIDKDDCIKIIKGLKETVILLEGKNEVRTKSGIKDFLSLDSYVYFATPSRLGKATAGVSGIDGGFKKVGEKIMINEEPYSEIEFDLYCFENALNANIDFQIRYYDLE
ncbi:hypothetical protein SYJ56_04525 [Algoriphagus sp. D3-2-R+10]|uniref:hypothetical protein n=1 Tax=Algoriphagus aurantiacus TaxID=3103948 RepID=UPI002B3DEC32|nr:hypothetical protein [Algoriphagus sp. D3-2-R+10]MEB2774557.1 hypothetical protein [Algoriphagus sp. D3-2-R+10]